MDIGRNKYNFLFWKNDVAYAKPPTNTNRITLNEKVLFVASSDQQKYEKHPIIIIPKKTSNEHKLGTNENTFLLNYDKMNEHAGFKVGNASRMLACLVLSESIGKSKLPYDPYEAEAYFERFFKGTHREIFMKYCVFYKRDPDEILRYYKSLIKVEPPKISKKRTGTVDSMIATFFRMTKH